MSESAQTDELIELAAVTRAHGLGGGLLLKLFNPESELLTQLSEVIVRAPTGACRTYRVVSLRGLGDAPLLALEGVTTRSEAEALRGSVLCVERAALPALDEGEYYLVDLVGLAVRSQDGATIGRVEDVIDYPSVPCLVVVTGDERREVPDLPRYVTEVRVAEGYVAVDHLDELEPLVAAPPGRR